MKHKQLVTLIMAGMLAGTVMCAGAAAEDLVTGTTQKEVDTSRKLTADGETLDKFVISVPNDVTNWDPNAQIDMNGVLFRDLVYQNLFIVHLDDIVPLYAGDVFEIVFNTTCDKLSGVPISEIASLNKAIYYPEISYVSYDGVNWQDLFYLSKTYALHTYTHHAHKQHMSANRRAHTHSTHTGSKMNTLRRSFLNTSEAHMHSSLLLSFDGFQNKKSL